MKIYNFGNDYAFQQSQKQEKIPVKVKQPEISEPKSEDNAGNQVQNGGERAMEKNAKKISLPKRNARKKKK